MANVSDRIPAELQQDVDAALAWFNDRQAVPFQVTGIVDAELSQQSSEPRELHLVLCGGDACLKRDFTIFRASGELRVVCPQEADNELAQATDHATPSQDELDPPPGARRDWLDAVLGQAEYTFLIFYRGFW